MRSVGDAPAQVVPRLGAEIAAPDDTRQKVHVSLGQLLFGRGETRKQTGLPVAIPSMPPNDTRAPANTPQTTIPFIFINSPRYQPLQEAERGENAYQRYKAAHYGQAQTPQSKYHL